jgi:hypothetical protein
MKKLTKKEMFAMVREIVMTSDSANAEMLIGFIDHEVELLTKKNTGEKKPTKVQEANVGIKQVILTALEGQEAKTVSEIQTLAPELAELSNQKVASLVRQLVEEGKLTRIEEKRKAYFRLA